jgi:asparagine synthase (glutamine-hydrolysing)
MCGILGVLNPNERDRALFTHALDAIVHRGPDGQGVWKDGSVVLGHQRLAIIDLSDDGLQPMIDPATGLAIVFNGEIYNYIELRDELAGHGVTFHSHSDTEVLLKAYIRWGADMLNRLNGMWALAIWDPRKTEMFVSRDRFGVKPFYYAEIDGRFIFGSEPKALFKLDPRLAEPSAAAVADLFTTSEMHSGEKTFYARVKSLPPATYGFVTASTPLRVVPFWDYPEAEGETAEAFNFTEIFESALKLRLRSDVPVGLTLSGGLDSSAILAASVSVAGEPLRCFTSVYGSASRGEEHWAQIAAGIAKASLTSVESGLDDWHMTLEKAIYHMDAPGYSPAIVPLWAIMKHSRAEGVPVLLEGQGADELLGGYPRYSLPLLAEMAKDRSNWHRLPAEIRTLSRSFGVKWLALWTLRQSMPWGYDIWAKSRSGQSLLQDGIAVDPANDDSANSGSSLFDMLHEDHSRKILPALLHYGDAISMAHGIESRLPFMDYRLVEQVFRLRPKLIVDGKTKAPIRDYLNAHAFQPIAARLDKRGYPTPIHTWIEAQGGAYLRDALADKNQPVWDYLKRDVVQALLDRAVQGDVSALFQTFKIATTVLWLDNAKAARSAEIGQAAKSEDLGGQPFQAA